MMTLKNSRKELTCCISGKIIDKNDICIDFPQYLSHPRSPEYKCAGYKALRDVFNHWEHKERLVEEVREYWGEYWTFPYFHVLFSDRCVFIGYRFSLSEITIAIINEVFSFDFHVDLWEKLLNFIGGSEGELILDYKNKKITIIHESNGVKIFSSSDTLDCISLTISEFYGLCCAIQSSNDELTKLKNGNIQERTKQVAFENKLSYKLLTELKNKGPFASFGISVPRLNKAQRALGSHNSNLEGRNYYYDFWHDLDSFPNRGVELRQATSRWSSPLERNIENKKIQESPGGIEACYLTGNSSTDLLAINSWISQKVGSSFSPRISKLDLKDKLTVIDVLYFRGDWSPSASICGVKNRNYQYNDGPFYVHPFLQTNKWVNVYENKKFSVYYFSFQEWRFGLYLFFPNTKSDLIEITEEKITGKPWDDVMWKCGKDIGNFEFPSFNVMSSKVFEIDRKNLLPSEKGFVGGMPLNGGSNFDHFIQWTWVSVTEKGTEAISVTLSGGEKALLFDHLDYPHFSTVFQSNFLIRDNFTGINLFVGSF